MTFEIKNTTLSVDLTRKRNSPLLIIKNDTCTDIEIHICVFEVINIVHVFFSLLFLCANAVEKHILLYPTKILIQYLFILKVYQYLE